MITCLECRKVFPQVFVKAACLIKETDCLHSSSLIHCPAISPTFGQASQRKHENQDERHRGANRRMQIGSILRDGNVRRQLMTYLKDSFRRCSCGPSEK